MARDGDVVVTSTLEDAVSSGVAEMATSVERSGRSMVAAFNAAARGLRETSELLEKVGLVGKDTARSMDQAGSAFANAGQAARSLDIAERATTKLGKALGIASAARDAFQTGWDFGRAIGELTGLDKVIQSVGVTLFGVTREQVAANDAGLAAGRTLRDQWAAVRVEFGLTAAETTKLQEAMGGQLEMGGRLVENVRELGDGLFDIIGRTKEAADATAGHAAAQRDNAVAARSAAVAERDLQRELEATAREAESAAAAMITLNTIMTQAQLAQAIGAGVTFRPGELEAGGTARGFQGAADRRFQVGNAPEPPPSFGGMSVSTGLLSPGPTFNFNGMLGSRDDLTRAAGTLGAAAAGAGRTSAGNPAVGSGATPNLPPFVPRPTERSRNPGMNFWSSRG